MGSATLEGRIDMGDTVIINIRTWMDGHKPPDRVLPSLSSARCDRTRAAGTSGGYGARRAWRKDPAVILTSGPAAPGQAAPGPFSRQPLGDEHAAERAAVAHDGPELAAVAVLVAKARPPQ